MIRYWKQAKKLEEIQSYEKGCWVDVVAPTREEVDFLVNEFRVPEDFISDILDVDERSRTELEGRWLLIIMRIPVYLAKHSVPFYTIPMGVLISPNVTITISLHENEVTDIKQLQKFKKFTIENKHNFVLYLMLRSSIQYLNFLKIINRQTNNIEKEIQKSTKNSELRGLLRIEKCLVYFITSLKSNEVLLTKLQKLKISNSDQVDEDLLEDVIIENRQAAEMARIHSDILAGLMDAFASVVSNNLNTVMKTLTLVTILLMIPNIISGMFGMNVPNFLEKNTSAFYWIILTSVALSIVGVLFFRKRNYF